MSVTKVKRRRGRGVWGGKDSTCFVGFSPKSGLHLGCNTKLCLRGYCTSISCLLVHVSINKDLYMKTEVLKGPLIPEPLQDYISGEITGEFPLKTIIKLRFSPSPDGLFYVRWYNNQSCYFILSTDLNSLLLVAKTWEADCRNTYKKTQFQLPLLSRGIRSMSQRPGH